MQRSYHFHTAGLWPAPDDPGGEVSAEAPETAKAGAQVPVMRDAYGNVRENAFPILNGAS